VRKAAEPLPLPLSNARSLQPDDPRLADKVMLGTHGWKERYYSEKFGPDGLKPAFTVKLCQSYIEGLSWVMAYYYSGVVSWPWYYPYHYAPFASDLMNTDSMKIEFCLGAPLSPLAQLMGVLPAAR
jgi:5'-3' exonuclease